MDLAADLIKAIEDNKEKIIKLMNYEKYQNAVDNIVQSFKEIDIELSFGGFVKKEELMGIELHVFERYHGTSWEEMIKIVEDGFEKFEQVKNDWRDLTKTS